MSQNQFDDFKKAIEKDGEESFKVFNKLMNDFEDQQKKLEDLAQPDHTPSFLGVVSE